VNSLLATTSNIDHSPVYTAVIVIGLVLWILAIVALVTSRRR